MNGDVFMNKAGNGKNYDGWYGGVKMNLPLAIPHASKDGIVVPTPEERMMCMEIVRKHLL